MYKDHIQSLFKNNNVHKIYGTAGSGKTTFLLNELNGLFKKGIEPKEIAFVSFTNKAVDEIVERCVAKFKQFHPNQFIHFRTIHSMCYKTISTEDKEVVQQKELVALARKIGMQVSTYQSIEDGAGSKQGDKVINIESLARLRMVDIEQQWKDSNEKDCPLFLVKKWKRLLSEYKQENNLVDFTDMLESYDSHLPVKYIFIDEAQDLCPLQWKVMNRSASNAEQVYIAGDDDQSIFNWAGAIVDYFLDINCNKETILRHSYRLPSNVYQLSRKILSRIKNRKEKECSPINEDGVIKKISNFDKLQINYNDEYLILIRNRWQSKEIESVLRNKGLIYYSYNKNILDNDEVKVIQLWQQFQSTGTTEKRQYRKMQKYSTLLKKYSIEELPSALKRKEWYLIFNLMSRFNLQYYKKVAMNYDFAELPKIKISTIHQAKGGEADNVILFTDVSYNVWNNIRKDTEHKVWYVAVTRTKKNLFIIQERSSQFYKI